MSAALKIGMLRVDDWAGRLHVQVWIVGETPTKWRVRLPPRSTAVIPLPGRRRLIGAVPVLVPKTAVHVLGLGAALTELES